MMATSMSLSNLKLATPSKAMSSNAASRRMAVIVRAQQPHQHDATISRRNISLVALTAFGASLANSAGPAQAFLGLGDNGEEYNASTAKLIADITSALELDVADPAREQALRDVRKLSVDWVSRYRRDTTYGGRPSFSLLYSAVNALDGQLNSFGFTSKIPAKRLERLQKGLQDADRQLQRGR